MPNRITSVLRKACESASELGFTHLCWVGSLRGICKARQLHCKRRANQSHPHTLLAKCYGGSAGRKHPCAARAVQQQGWRPARRFLAGALFRPCTCTARQRRQGSQWAPTDWQVSRTGLTELADRQPNGTNSLPSILCLSARWAVAVAVSNCRTRRTSWLRRATHPSVMHHLGITTPKFIQFVVIGTLVHA